MTLFVLLFFKDSMVRGEGGSFLFKLVFLRMPWIPGISPHAAVVVVDSSMYQARMLAAAQALRSRR